MYHCKKKKHICNWYKTNKLSIYRRHVCSLQCLCARCLASARARPKKKTVFGNLKQYTLTLQIIVSLIYSMKPHCQTSVINISGQLRTKILIRVLAKNWNHLKGAVLATQKRPRLSKIKLCCLFSKNASVQLSKPNFFSVRSLLKEC